jgi:hypothetical protein
MPRNSKPKHDAGINSSGSSAQPAKEDSSEFNRAPRQKHQDRDAVKSAEQTRDIPNKHGAIK